MAAQAGDHPGELRAVSRVLRCAAGQRPADGVEGAQRVLEVGGVLRLRPGRELHADRAGAPADVQHLAVDAQAQQHVAVRARAEPELVAVPAAGERELGGRRGEGAAHVGIDGPGLAEPAGRDDTAGPFTSVRDGSAVQQQLAEPGHVAGGGAQPAVVHRGAEAVADQVGVVLGAHRRPDQRGDEAPPSAARRPARTPSPARPTRRSGRGTCCRAAPRPGSVARNRYRPLGLAARHRAASRSSRPARRMSACGLAYSSRNLTPLRMSSTCRTVAPA